MRLIYLILFLLSFFTYSQHSLDYSFSRINKELLTNSDAVVRFDKLEIEISSIDKMVFRGRQVITILNEKGNSHARMILGYDNEKRIRSLNATIYDKNGKKIKDVRKKEFRDYSATDGFSLYTDNRVLAFTYLPIEYPYTIDFKYEAQTSDTGAIPSWYFTSDYNISVEKSEYTIQYAVPDLKPVIIESNMGDIDFQKNVLDDRIYYTAQNIHAINQEILSPSFQSFVPKLLVRLPKFNYKGVVGSINSWEDAGLWMGKLLKGQDKLPANTINTINHLVGGAKDDLEKAKIVHQYVQDNTRYISVQVGIGGLKPISAIEVDEVKYGDCKGLSNYTIALLKAVGVKAFYTVVEAGSNKVDFLDDFADLAQGNHVIVAIPYNDKYYWIDCTSQVHPFGFIGDFTDDRKALVVKPNGGELVKTQAYLDSVNFQLTTSKLKINSEGSVIADVQIKTKGIQYDYHFNLEYKNDDDVIDYYKDYWDNIGNLRINNYQFVNDKKNVVFTEEVKITASKYATFVQDKIIFEPNLFNNHSYVPKRYRNRKLPFKIQRGYLDEDEIKISIPGNYEFESIPEAFEIDNKFGFYKIRLEKHNENLVLKRKVFIKSGLYPNTEYESYRNFMRTISKRDRLKIVLNKSIKHNRNDE